MLTAALDKVKNIYTLNITTKSYYIDDDTI